jgi:serine/threonine protein kinase
LKTHNILLSSNGKVVVADFGLAVNMEANTMLSNGAGGTALGTASYMAPEQFSGGKVDDKCDAYAFGCILWECITGRQPWEECNNLMQIVMAVGLERRRPPLPRGVPGPLASIIRECWRHNPALRPSMKEIAERLQALKKDEEQALAFKAAASLSIKKSPRQKLGTPRSPLSKGAEWNEKWSPVKGTRMAEIRSGS